MMHKLLLFMFLFATLALLTAPPAVSEMDSDNDTIPDSFDNCTQVPNPGQADDDRDGCGNVCDPELVCDLTLDGVVGGPDFVLQSRDFGCSAEVCEGDCTGDGATGGPDFVAMSKEFGQRKGPSKISYPSRDPLDCPL